ncbi:MAG TPA: hypothetical protein VG275_14090 [Solirubrobacteraceae bacterium]|nr:hypothetical protein [Solirubrobacteraceae bacterium]
MIITDLGITVAVRGFSRFPRPSVSLSWDELERVEPVRGAIPVPGNVGIAFHGDRRLVFWCSKKDRNRILEDTRRRARGKLAPEASSRPSRDGGRRRDRRRHPPPLH